MKVGVVVVLFCLAITLAACVSQGGAPNEVDLLGTAAVEATQIIQQAQATALVLNAQRQATALIAEPGGQPNYPLATPETAATQPVRTPEVQSTPATGEEIIPSQTPQVTTVELLSVEIVAEGNFIEVDFLAPPAVAGGWYQGNVSVIDEASGTVYSEIPVMPVIGPLFGKPVEAGQLGYVMLVNAPVPLQPGAQVTVNLGEYSFEHIPVK